MQAVTRKYSGKGAKELIDLLEKNAADIERLLRAVQGLVSYTLVRAGDGGFSVTVCRDQAGIDESVKVAREWIAKNAAHIGASAPEVTAGGVLLHLK